MKTLHDIEKEIKTLDEKLSQTKGRATEVYSRIVGYYRSISNWNKGKRAEFDERRTFDVPANGYQERIKAAELIA